MLSMLISFLLAFTGFLGKYHAIVISKAKFLNSTWFEIEALHSEGKMKGFMTPDDVNEYLASISKEFPELVLDYRTIGISLENREIKAISLTIREANKNSSKPRILFTSSFHGHEPISTSFQLYCISKLIHGFLHEDPSVVSLLTTRELWFIPLLNVDGLAFIYGRFLKDSFIRIYYKNRRNTSNYLNSTDECGEFGIGVDLNCNFNFVDRTDSLCKPLPCDPFFRGISPLSEPETKAFNDFVNRTKFNMVINYFSTQNKVLIPNQNKTNEINKGIYKQISEEGYFPQGIRIGTTTTLKEKYQEDVSQYILDVYDVPALSHYIGSQWKYSDFFFPDKTILQIIKDNIDSMFYFATKIGHFLRIDFNIEGNCGEFPECSFDTADYLYRVNISNTGLQATMEDFNIFVTLSGSTVFEISMIGISDEGKIKAVNYSIVSADYSEIIYKIKYENIIQAQRQVPFSIFFKRKTKGNPSDDIILLKMPDIKIFFDDIFVKNNIFQAKLGKNREIAKDEISVVSTKFTDFSNRKESYIVLIIFSVISSLILIACLISKIKDRVNQRYSKGIVLPKITIDDPTNHNLIVSQEMTMMHSDLHQPVKDAGDLEKAEVFEHSKND